MFGIIGLVAIAAAGMFEDKVVKAAEAKEHVNEKCVVEFTVKNGRMLPDKNMCFLNSESNFRDGKNFTAVIFKDGLERFKEMKIEDPYDHYKKKKIRITGKIELRDGKAQMKVIDPSQIKLVAEEGDAKKKDDDGKAKADK